jgi:hypothetical protein
MLGIGLLVVMLALSEPSRANECKEALQVTTPCKGLLIPPADAEECLKCKLDLQAEKEYGEVLQDLWQADIDEMENLLGIEQRRAAELSKLLDKRLDPPPFYETVWFGVVVGLVGGVALTWSIVEVRQ